MTRPGWHALLAPIPPDAVPTRTPVGTPEVRASPEGATIAGWEQLVLHLSAGGEGLRILLVVLDAAGTPMAASDHVLIRSTGGDAPGQGRIRQESIGGSLAPDGTFAGTCWLTTGPAPEPDKTPEWDSTPSPPSESQVAALRALVADLLARAP